MRETREANIIEFIRQRCTFHQAMNLAGHCEQPRHKRRIVQDALAVFAARTQTEARQRLRHFMQTWSDKEPKAVRNLLKGFEYRLTYLDYPEPRRRKLKTNNSIERTIEELNRRLIPMRPSTIPKALKESFVA